MSYIFKRNFVQFDGILDKVGKKIQSAGEEIEDASRKTRTIQKKLRDVSAMDQSEATKILDLENTLLDNDSD